MHTSASKNSVATSANNLLIGKVKTRGSNTAEVKTPLWGNPPARAARLTALALRLQTAVALDAVGGNGLASTAI